MGTGKNVARERDTRGERERPPESPVKIVYSISPRVPLSRAPLFPVPLTSKRLLRRLLRFMLAFSSGNAYACACVTSEDWALQGKAANKFFIILQMLVLTSLKLKGPNLSLSLFP